MNHSMLVKGLRLLLAMLATGLGFSAQAQDYARVEDSIQAILEANFFDLNADPPAGASGGAQAAVISGGEIVVAENAFYNLGNAVNDSTRMGLGDLSMHFLAVLTLRMEEEGLLSTSDQFGTNVFPLPAATLDPLVPPATTIEQLLTHTSGINDFADQTGYYDPNLSPWLGDLSADYRTLNSYAPIIGTQINSQGPAAAAGTFDYGLFPYLALGVKLESVGGKRLDSLFQQYVLDKVGGLTLADIEFFDGEDASAMNTTTAYYNISGILPEALSNQTSFLTSTGGSGSMVGSPKAVLTLTKALFDGNLLSAASIAKLTNFSTITGRASEAYGMGTERFSLNISGSTKTYIGHVGHATHKAILLYRAEDNVGVFISSNLNNLSDTKDQDSMLVALAEKMLAKALIVVGNEPGVTTLASTKLYPVPAQNLLQVELTAVAESRPTFTVYNQIGQAVGGHTLLAGSQTYRLDVSDLQTGVYFLQIQQGEAIETHKFMIQR